MPTVFRAQLRRHRFQLSGKQKIQEQRFENIVTVMAQRDFCGPQFSGDAVEMSAAESRAERAGRLSFRDQPFDDRISVPLFDMERNSNRREILRQNMRWKAGLFLVQADGNQVESDRRAPL